ncbi:MAG: J domain-containing protein [Planctomycetota bacterium]
MADQDYYKLLGVSKTASEDEIQKAYRKAARKYHPDLHVDQPDREKEKTKQQFQKIQQAYDVLSDPQKRQMYDQLGPGFENMSGAGGGNPFGAGSPFGNAGGFDFSQIFGGGGGGGAGGFEELFRQMGGGPGGGNQRRARPTKGQDLEQEITVPFNVSVLGGSHHLSFQRSNGKVENIDLKIPAGIESGKKIRLRGQGGKGGQGGPDGDLLVIVKVAPHPSFTRKGLNLHVNVPVTLLEAIEGAKIDVPTPYGTVSLTVPPGSSSGKSLRLKGMGIKEKNRSGDLFAILQIVIPNQANPEDIELLKRLGEEWNMEEPRGELIW